MEFEFSDILGHLIDVVEDSIGDKKLWV